MTPSCKILSHTNANPSRYNSLISHAPPMRTFHTINYLVLLLGGIEVSKGHAGRSGQHRVTAEVDCLVQPALGRGFVILCCRASAGAQVKIGCCRVIASQSCPAGCEGEATRERTVVKQGPPYIGATLCLRSCPRCVTLVQRQARRQFGGVGLVLGLLGGRNSSPCGLQSGHVSSVISNQATKKRCTSGPRIATGLDLYRNRVRRGQLIGAIQSDCLREA